MRSLLAVLLLMAAGCATPATDPAQPAETEPEAAPDYDASGPYSRTLREGRHAILPPVVETLRSDRDGVPIELAIVRPDVEAPVPMIVVASPYYAPMTPDNVVAKEWRAGISYAQGVYLLFGERFVPHGYALALVAVRGTGGSGGCVDLNGLAEREDLDQAITWLAGQPWSTGHVGMVGGSYDGTTQWGVASMGNPHVKTIVPLAAVSDLYGLLHRNGTLDTRGTGTALAHYWTYGFATNQPANGRPPDDTRDGALCPGFAEGMQASLHASATSERSAWYKERDLRPGTLAGWNGSVLVVHGLSDRVVIAAQSWPWVNELEARGMHVKHLVGQWGHAWPDMPDQGEPRWDWAETLLRWFDRWLRMDATVDTGPRAEVQDSSGRWRVEATWPPADARPLPLHLSPEGELRAEPSDTDARLLLCPDPTDGFADAPPAARNLACVPGAWLATEPLEKDLRFAGLPTLHATVIPHGPGGHLVARLLVADPTGERVVARAQMDLRYADGTETPRPVQPGVPLLARMQFEPTDAHVPAGARLFLTLRQGSLEERMPSLPTWPLDLLVGGADGPSVLTLPTLERSPDAFFDPPR